MTSHRKPVGGSQSAVPCLKEEDIGSKATRGKCSSRFTVICAVTCISFPVFYYCVLLETNDSSMSYMTPDPPLPDMDLPATKTLNDDLSGDKVIHSPVLKAESDPSGDKVIHPPVLNAESDHSGDKVIHPPVLNTKHDSSGEEIHLPVLIAENVPWETPDHRHGHRYLNHKFPIVECVLTTGTIAIEVHPEWAPLGAERFLELVRSRYYDGSALFRAIRGFLVQFGISENEKMKREWNQRPPLKDDYLRPDVPIKLGTMAFAGSGTNSRTTQVWIAFSHRHTSLGKKPWETPFAQVIGESSLAAVRRINTEYGNAVNQTAIRKLGYKYLRHRFPRLSYIRRCIEKWNPDAAAAAAAAAASQTAHSRDLQGADSY